MEKEEKGSYKVKDNRRFDSEGNERPDVSSPTSVPPVSQPEARKTDAPPKPSPAKQERPSPVVGAQEEPQESQEGDIDFSSFIVSLGTQALMQLGLVNAPDGTKIPKDVVAAKETIDIIAMLETKTRGNLSADEQKLVTEVLHSLRLGFIKANS